MSSLLGGGPLGFIAVGEIMEWRGGETEMASTLLPCLGPDRALPAFLMVLRIGDPPEVMLLQGRFESAPCQLVITQRDVVTPVLLSPGAAALAYRTDSALTVIVPRAFDMHSDRAPTYTGSYSFMVLPIQPSTSAAVFGQTDGMAIEAFKRAVGVAPSPHFQFAPLAFGVEIVPGSGDELLATLYVED